MDGWMEVFWQLLGVFIWTYTNVQRSLWRAVKSMRTWKVVHLVHFLRDSAHFSAHITYEEEADCGDSHCDLCDPEGRVPAVLFRNCAEGESSHKSPHWNKTSHMKWSTLKGWKEGDTCQMHNLPFAISATMEWQVPQNFEGALSLAITPNKAVGP